MINKKKEETDRKFLKTVVTTLGERAHFLCSNPTCRKMTNGPHSNEDKSLRSGEAAHIYSAYKINARHNANLDDEQIRNIKNGIWLCRDCHKQIDNDEQAFPASLMFQWKKTHEIFVKALRSNSSSGTLELLKPTINEELNAKNILEYLDDRRVFSTEIEYEFPYHVFLSLQDTRKELVKRKSKLSKSFLSQEIGKMLKAIRTFLDTIYDIDINHLRYDRDDKDWIKFENSLSTLRKVIGVIVLQISDKYQIEIGYELKKIIPDNSVKK